MAIFYSQHYIIFMGIQSWEGKICVYIPYSLCYFWDISKIYIYILCSVTSHFFSFFILNKYRRKQKIIHLTLFTKCQCCFTIIIFLYDFIQQMSLDNLISLAYFLCFFFSIKQTHKLNLRNKEKKKQILFSTPYELQFLTIFCCSHV